MNAAMAVGTVDWTHRTGGHLEPSERRRLVADLARVHIGNAVGRISVLAHLNSGRNAYVPPARLAPPDSPLTRAAEDAATRALPPTLLNHSYRTYRFGRALGELDEVEVDVELLFAAALLHDTGLVMATGRDDFTLTSARVARDVAEQAGLSTTATETLQTAITMHHSPRVTLAAGSVAYLLSAGAGVDVAGLRCWELPRAVLADAVREHPRESFKKYFALAWADEAARVRVAGQGCCAGMAPSQPPSPLPRSRSEPATSGSAPPTTQPSLGLRYPRGMLPRSLCRDAPYGGRCERYGRLVLHGRERERAQLAALVEKARAGTAGVLVVLGEPGVGKTALLQNLTTSQEQAAAGAGVLRTAGVESESPLPYAALHRLLRPATNFDRLPAPQARALRVAFGLEDGPTIEPFLIGVATLSVLTEAADAGSPLLCVVDDAQWLDSASADALLFAARQLSADPVAMVFAARTGEAGAPAFTPPGLPVLQLGGLDDEAARRLLDERSGDRLPREVADRLVNDTGGNPLALLELPSGLSPAQLHGDAPLPQQLTLTAGVERAFLDRCRRLSEQVQTLLLVAAADATGRAGTVRQAAGVLGVQAPAWQDAERSGLLTLTGDVVEVRHPLVRSAVYQAATSFERRQAHRALADAVGPDDPDRATWHRAAASDGPDADIADALYEVAVRAEQRGGHVAAADAYERTASLTANEPARASRLFGAARSAWAAGQAVRARALASSARELAADPLLRADIDRLRARIEANVGSAVSAHRIFTVAARTVADFDAGRSLEMACAAALNRTYGSDSGAALTAEVLTRLLTQTDADTQRTACLRLLLGTLTASAEGDWGRAAATLEDALGAGRQVEDLDVMGNLGNAALHLGHDEGARFYYSAMVSTAREHGAGMVVIYALERLAFAQLPIGAWTAMRSSVDEALTLARSVGQPTLTAAPLASLTLLAALSGSNDFDRHLAEVDDIVARHPLGILTDPVHDVTRWAKGARATAEGDAPAALHHMSGMRVPALHRMVTVDRIEAAVRAGDRKQALTWVAELTPFATATNHPWALAALDLGRALTAANPADTAAAFERAVGHYQHACRPYDLARAQLAYGEFLRRANRRVDARTHLRSALEAFADLGATPLLARAEQELRASGETARRRDPSTLLNLTPMERKIARLVSTGLSNKDVAAQCWVSPRTVAFHLRNVFTKVGVSSRTELAQLDFS